MKYNFVDKAKELTPDDIKAQMNFDNVVKGASIWAGFKLGSVLLKLGSKVTTSIVAGTSTVVVTAAVVVGTSTDLFKSNETTTQLPPAEIQYEQEDDMVPPMNTGVVTDSTATKIKITTTPAKKVVSKPPVKPVVKPLPQSKVVPHSIVPNNVTIDARPLPDLLSFEKFIDNELVYPVSFKDGKREFVEGYVDVFWTVNRKGEAVNFKIRKSLGEAFDNEAIRVLKKYPNWEPGSFNGVAVESNLTFKIYFKVK